MLLVSNRNFQRVFAAAGVSNLADGIAALAFPWLATLLTRDPVLIGAVAGAGRLPWLLLSLPAGVMIDRSDKLVLIARADMARVVMTAVVIALTFSAPSLPVTEGGDGALWLIFALIFAAFCIGCAEVLRDNAVQTVLPEVLDAKDLQAANGQIWSIESICNRFIGPPLAGLVIAYAIPAPFALNCALFLCAALLMLSLPRRPRPDRPGANPRFVPQFYEGLRWLTSNPLFLRLAVMLGCMNFLTMMSATLLVLLSQEIFHLDAAGHGILLGCAAAGGVLGGLVAPSIAARIGDRRSIYLSLFLMILPYWILALTKSPILAAFAVGLELFAGMLWNVVTVSYRQTHIPTALLGRVNATYRFFAWGPIPVSAIIAGALVTLAEHIGLDRTQALRVPYLLGAATSPLILIYALTRLRFPAD